MGLTEDGRERLRAAGRKAKGRAASPEKKESIRASLRDLHGTSPLCRLCKERPRRQMANGRFYAECERCVKDANYQRRYGITLEQYDRMAGAQRGRCYLCRQEPTNDKRLFVDHNHETGEVRGLLCFQCNFLEGLLAQANARRAAFIATDHSGSENPRLRVEDLLPKYVTRNAIGELR